MTVRNVTGFAGACQEAVIAVWMPSPPLARHAGDTLRRRTGGRQGLARRPQRLGMVLADDLRLGIKEVEARAHDAAEESGRRRTDGSRLRLGFSGGSTSWHGSNSTSPKPYNRPFARHCQREQSEGDFAGSLRRFTRSRVTYEADAASRTSTRLVYRAIFTTVEHTSAGL